MSKIGILTFTYGDNYGQRLQNLAVQQIVQDMGFEAYTIRQKKNINYLIQYTKKNIKNICNGSYSIDKLRHQLFYKFDRENIKYYSRKISEKTMNSFPEENFDYFITGSDQIWSPYSKDVNATFFLSFTALSKRISIAPSFASEDIPLNLLDKYGDYLKGFNILSVREERSAEFIQSHYGLEADVLIDPTLMFPASFWEKYERKPDWLQSNSYVVLYFLGLNNKEIPLNYINNTVITLQPGSKYWASGPAEFLYLIRHANLVVTDSYHGSIFSLIFDIPLIIKERDGDKIGMASRFETLYNKFELKKDLKTGLVLRTEFEKMLEMEQEKFLEYLKRSFIN